MAHKESPATPSLTASIIVPVSKKHGDVLSTLASLEAQTLDHATFEVIFVDAGAKGAGLKDVRTFAKDHAWIRVSSQAAKGTFAALNIGIDEAKGKYLFFLMPGDALSDNALSAVTGYFDKHYDEVDLVAYNYLVCDGEERNQEHFRYEILKGTGIYDLDESNNYYVCQTDPSVCVKNRFEGNVHFEHPELDAVHVEGEVQYVCDVLRERSRMGYCASASYLYCKPPVVVAPEDAPAYYSFEGNMALFEGLFERCVGEVPRFMQAFLVDDFVRRVQKGTLLPNHLDGDEHDQAMDRLARLMSQVSDEVVFTHPTSGIHHALFISGLASSSDARVLSGPGGVSVTSGDTVMWVSKKIEVFLLRTRVNGTSFEVTGAVRSPIFAQGSHDFHLLLCSTKKGAPFVEELDLSASGESYCDSTYKVSNFPSFRCALPLDRVTNYTFVAVVDGRNLPVTLVCKRRKVTFGIPLLNTMVCGDRMIVLRAGQGTISIGQRTKELYDAHVNNLKNSLDRRVRLVRTAVEKLSAYLHKKYEEVWVYTDAAGRLDNAWLQFLHDAPLTDGVMRYYVANGVEISKEDLPQGSSCKVIAFGSWMHRIIHWVADRRLASDVSPVCMSCWDAAARAFYADYDNAEIIYLQHGVLWAHIPWYYDHDKVLIDRMVVSTQFEIDNLTQNYGFRESDLIPAGMARYDFIEHEQPAEKKILLCPSWRSYLVGELSRDGREPLEATFKTSDYYKNLVRLMRNKRLTELLERCGYTLDLKLHPNFACYAHLFKDFTGTVRLVETAEHEHAYAAIITDYSSYSFDFAYLNRAIVYYIPDEELFRAGLSNYHELDMDLDDALGAHARTPDEVVEALERMVMNERGADNPYAERERSFYLHYDKENRQRLYDAVRT